MTTATQCHLRPAEMPAGAPISAKGEIWLGDLDSNQGWRSQSPQSYR
jgi:hypothetical protein